MKILKLNIERCGDCPNITFTGTKGWICDKLLEQVHPEKIALLCPLEDDAPKTCATCRHYGDVEKCHCWPTVPDFGCIDHEAKK